MEHQKTWAEVVSMGQEKDLDRPLPPIQPWSTKMNYLFGTLPGSVRRQLKWDDVALYSVMKSTDADAVTKAMLERLKKSKPEQSSFTMIDATACIGGNTISFAAQFQNVISVEISPERAKMLEFNVEIAGFKERVTVIQGDFLDLDLSLLQPDGVFLDPPWGGPEYKNYTNLDLYLGSKNIVDVIRDILVSSRIIGIRLPFNYNFERLKTLNCKIEFISISKFTLALISN